MTKPISVIIMAFLFVRAGAFAEENRGGIVYGPKAAFKIDAPEGWVLDNEAGAEQGLPCILYPKGESWANARTVMYAKIASTDYEDAEKFATVAIKQMESRHGKPKEKINIGKTGDGQAFFINEIPRHENVFSMGTCRLRAVAQVGGLHRSVIAGRGELSQGFVRTYPSVEDIRVSRAEDGERRALSEINTRRSRRRDSVIEELTGFRIFDPYRACAERPL